MSARPIAQPMGPVTPTRETAKCKNCGTDIARHNVGDWDETLWYHVSDLLMECPGRRLEDRQVTSPPPWYALPKQLEPRLGSDTPYRC